MRPATTKDKVLKAIEDLPSDATIEDAMEKLFFLSKVEEGLSDAESGRTMSHKDARRLWQSIAPNDPMSPRRGAGM